MHLNIVLGLDGPNPFSTRSIGLVWVGVFLKVILCVLNGAFMLPNFNHIHLYLFLRNRAQLSFANKHI